MAAREEGRVDSEGESGVGGFGGGLGGGGGDEGGESRFLTGLCARFGMTKSKTAGSSHGLSLSRNRKSKSRFLTGLSARFGMTKAEAGSSPGFAPGSE